MPSLIDPPPADPIAPAFFEPFVDQIDDIDTDVRRPEQTIPVRRSLLDGREEGLPIETPRVTATPAGVALSTLLAWILAVGLGIGGAMAALLLRHRVELMLSRLL